jgi:hypothetical protein
MILILSIENDNSTNEVIKWLSAKNKGFIRINDTDKLKIETIEINKDKISVTIISSREKFKISDISAYWYRRGKLNVDYDRTGHKGIDLALEKESTGIQQFVNQCLNSIPKKIGSYNDNFLNKLHNLLTAQRLGLNVPKTLIASQKHFIDKTLTSSKAITDIIGYDYGNNQQFSIATAHLQNPVFRHKALIAGKEKKEYQELP